MKKKGQHCSMPKGYADGGKVRSGYGEPTYARAVLARVGIGDGYGNPKDAPKPKKLDVSNAASGLKDVIAKRKAELDSYANGGRVKKKSC